MNYGMDYEGGSGGGGGFTSGGGGYGGGGSQGSGGGGGGNSTRVRKAYDDQTLIPVTARMIINTHSTSNAEGTSSLALADDRELYRVKVVGAVRSVEDFSTNVQYSIEDGTGLIEVKQWNDDNDVAAVVEMRQACLKENIYIKVIGEVKDYDGKKTLVADTVRPLSSSNELSYHMLEVVYSAESFQKRESIGGLPNMAMPTGGGVGFGSSMPSSSMPIGQSSTGGSGDGLRDHVLNYIKTEGEQSDIGAPVQRCIEMLSGKYSQQQVRQAIESLAAEGHVYSTVNEEHYKFAM